MISWLHSFSDVLIMAAKVLGETNFSNTSAVVFVMSMIIWFYMRLFVFPWLAWWSTFQDSPTGYNYIWYFFGYGLFCLVFMHAYWFYMFIKILHHYMTKGKTEDLIEEDITPKKGDEY